MNLTADKIIKLKLIDHIIQEPLGGAHRDYDAMASAIKNVLIKQLTELQSYPIPSLLEERYRRIMGYGLTL